MCHHGRDLPMLTIEEYAAHCAAQKTKKREWSAMCAPLTKIRNLTAKQLLEKYGQDNSSVTDLAALLRKIGISALPKDFSE